MATVDVQVGASNGDGYNRTVDPEFSNNAAYIVLGDYTATIYNSIGWALFPSVAIPAGVTITAAYASVVAYEAPQNPATIRIQAEDVDDPDGIDNVGEFNSHYANKTTAYADWVISTFSGWEDTPSIIDVIQEIIVRPGWASGQNIMLFFTETPYGYSARNQLLWRSWNWNPDYAAKLHIEYSEGGVVAGEAGQAAFLVSQGQI